MGDECTCRYKNKVTGRCVICENDNGGTVQLRKSGEDSAEIADLKAEITRLRQDVEIANLLYGALANGYLDEHAVKAGESIATLTSENERLREQSVCIYNAGYAHGHHDTVESNYVDIHSCDLSTYHAEEALEATR